MYHIAMKNTKHFKMNQNWHIWYENISSGNPVTKQWVLAKSFWCRELLLELLEDDDADELESLSSRSWRIVQP
jgi:hypothetical protein